jgi:8-oxo-dGTP pyrophosphatase MutT (NUDIX family)
VKNWLKNNLYKIALFGARIYWRVFKPVTYGARIMVICNNKILLVQPRTLSYWNLPGGGINKDEDPEAAAFRELYEELGIKIDNTDYLLGTYTSNSEGKKDTIYIFVKNIETEIAPKVQIEIGNARYFDINELPENTTKRTKFRINEYQKGLKNISGFWTKNNE